MGDSEYYTQQIAAQNSRADVVAALSTGAYDPRVPPSGLVNAADVGYDVILCAGQSNMWGQGIPVDTTYLDTPDARVDVWAGSGLYPSQISRATEPVPHPETPGYGPPLGIGPALSFARWYAASIPTNRRVLLVARAVGSTRIATDWDPAGSNNLYTAAISATNAAIAAAGSNTRFIGTIWLQGESDAIASYSAATYQAKLDALIAGIRAAVTGAANTLFVVGEMVPEFTTGTAATIRAIHRETPSRLPRTGWAYGVVGSNNGDNLHYNSAAQRRMGRRFFDAWQAAATNDGTPRPPLAPPTLTSTFGNGQVALAWTAPAGPGAVIVDYIVQYKLSNADSWTTFADGSSTTPAATVTGLTNEASYDFRVAGFSGGGVGAWSPTTTATPTAATAPGAPTSLVANSGLAQAVLTWTAPASDGGRPITDYQVQYRTTTGPGTWTTFTDAVTATTGATVTGLTPSVGYDFRVAALNVIGTGAYSSTASATPTAPTPFLTDTFTGTNGTAITAHSPDVGGTWTLKTGSAALALNGAGKGVLTGTGATATTWYNTTTPGSADYAASLAVKPAVASDNEVGPMIRVDTSLATYLTACWVLTGGSTKMCVVQSNAGSVSIIGTGVVPSGAVSTSETYTITLAAAGTAVTCRVQRASDSQWLASDGTWQALQTNCITTTTAVTGTGRAGIFAAITGSANTTVDDFSAA